MLQYYTPSIDMSYCKTSSFMENLYSDFTISSNYISTPINLKGGIMMGKRVIENSASTKIENTNTRIENKNWGQIVYNMIPDSRGFTLEEKVFYANFLKNNSKVVRKVY